MRKVVQLFNRIDSGFFFVAQMAVIIMMILTSISAIMRYIFNKGIVGAYEFTANYLMVAIIFLSISYVWKMGGHISLDLLDKYIPTILKKLLNILYTLLTAGIMFAIGYQAMLVTVEAYMNKYVATGIIPWPTWLSWIWIPIGSYIFTLRLTLSALLMLFNNEHLLNDKETSEEI